MKSFWWSPEIVLPLLVGVGFVLANLVSGESPEVSLLLRRQQEIDAMLEVLEREAAKTCPTPAANSAGLSAIRAPASASVVAASGGRSVAGCDAIHDGDCEQVENAGEQVHAAALGVHRTERTS